MKAVDGSSAQAVRYKAAAISSSQPCTPSQIVTGAHITIGWEGPTKPIISDYSGLVIRPGE
jgi:hypothetical protein